MAQSYTPEEERVAIECFDNFYKRSLESYGFFVNKLSKIFPNIYDFIHPMQSSNSLGLSIEADLTAQFNQALHCFSEMLKQSAYLQAKLKLKVDDKVSDILPEYAYQIEKGEVISTSQFANFYVEKTGGSRLITFTSFTQALKDRHYQLVKQGRIPAGTPFGKYYEAECGVQR